MVQQGLPRLGTETVRMLSVSHTRLVPPIFFCKGLHISHFTIISMSKSPIKKPFHFLKANFPLVPTARLRALRPWGSVPFHWGCYLRNLSLQPKWAFGNVSGKKTKSLETNTQRNYRLPPLPPHNAAPSMFCPHTLSPHKLS